MRYEFKGRMSGARVVKVMNNQSVTECIGGKTCHFRSKFERNWTAYLEMMKQTDHLIDWEYERTNLEFKDELRGVKVWLLDHRVIEPDGQVVYQELKGLVESKDVTRFVRASKYYPNIQIDLVVQANPSGKKKLEQMKRIDRISRTSACRRVIYASEIFKQIKGFVRLI